MLRVRALPRSEIDAWPVAEAGVTARIANCARAASLETVGRLRAVSAEDLLALPHFGRRSLQQLRAFLRACNRLAAGELEFRTVREVFDLVLSRAQWNVLVGRYGLFRPQDEASRGFHTLQELANPDGLTRERVRQIEAVALARASSRLANACLAPLRARVERRLREAGGVLPVEEFGAWRGEAVLDGLSPCPLVLLLADLAPGSWWLHRGCFCLAPVPALEAAEAAAAARLRENRGVLPGAEVEAAARAAAGDGGPAGPALATLLARAPGVLALRDGRYAGPDSLDLLLAEVVPAGAPPLRYARIEDALHERLRPPARVATGPLLRALAGSRLFRRTAPGTYQRPG